MGCDIHPAIEYKQDGAWKAVLFPNRWADGLTEPPMTASLDIGRDYNLFAILGNVRNDFGFEPMSDSRGVPDDISDEAREALSDEHSATWVTLAEILDYDWTTESGIVTAVTFLDWDWIKRIDPYNRPDSWCQGTSAKVIPAEDMKAQVDAIRGERHGRDEAVQKEVRAAMGSTSCRVEWPMPYAKAGRQLWEVALPKMLELGRELGFDNVRLVMDFDS